MTRGTWKCPYIHCQQECGRNWNLERHIARKHRGMGVPVKNKPSVHDHQLIEKSSKDTKLSPFDSGQPTTSKYGEENDVIDSAYEDFKKIKSRQAKFTEMKNFFKPSNSTIFPQLSFDDPAIGFRTYICAYCLTGPVDPVRVSDYKRIGPRVFQLNHTCKKEDLQRRITTGKQKYDPITKWNRLRLNSIRFLANLIHQWAGLHKDIYIRALEVFDSESRLVGCLPINLGKINKNHWAARAFISKENKRTAINDTELMDFLNLAKATFAPFCAEIDGKERYFYLYICPESMEIILPKTPRVGSAQ